MNMTRPKIQQAMAHYAGELSGLCMYPASMVLQRGGNVLNASDLQNLVVKTLMPLVRQLDSEASFQDFRLPGSLFLSSEGQKAELEGPFAIQPGRMSLKIAIKDIDGSVVRRVTETVFVDQWVEVSCAGNSS
jgi:flagella basal body P-ring formation protein FlgA